MRPHRDGGESFVDALVLAGDIAVGADIPRALALACTRDAPRPVLYVHGNHEFFGRHLGRRFMR